MTTSELNRRFNELERKLKRTVVTRCDSMPTENVGKIIIYDSQIFFWNGLIYEKILTEDDPAATGTTITAVAGYSLLPDPTLNTGDFYWVENDEGTWWAPGSLGGTYYKKGLYYSTGVSWETAPIPYQATQIEVNAGIEQYKFVTSETLSSSTQWDTKLNIVDLPSNLFLYPTTAPSDIATYYKLVTDIHDADFNTVAVDINTGAISSAAQLISSLATTLNLITGNPGVFNITVVGNIRKISGSGNADFYFEVYKRDGGGIETLIGTSNTTLVVSSATYEQFSATALWDDGLFLSTDRVVLKFYANRIAGGSNPEYQFQFGGTAPVRALVPVPLATIGYTKAEVDNLILSLSAYTYKTAAYNIQDIDRTVECNGTFTLTLPLLSTITHREDITIKNSGTGTITIQTSGGELLEDTTTFPIYQGESLTLQKGNTTYIVK
jgi:hypothetical protein